MYTDSAGNQVLNGMNNFKDCIVMAYVIMQGDFDTDTTARDALILDLWDSMNGVVTWEETSIYCCSKGCEKFHYECNKSEDYTRKAAEQTAGVGFYEDMKPYTPYGDSYSVTCNGCTVKDKGKTKTTVHPEQKGYGEAVAAAGCTNHTITYYCYGHQISACYGHKDIEIQIPLEFMEDRFETMTLPSGTSYQSYVSVFEGWTEDNIEWAHIRL